jgi:uncharacterized protein YyaL (SSP411 family)
VHTNRLINESSPYLLQHAHNPVEWHPWGDEAFAKAKAENKLVLVSIGYSACHWCHVMEHESFEDEEVAGIMNDYYVCIKVDREERPDVDQVYMDAVQIISGRGGWPLNCFTLADGRPVYGGTYFPKDNWKQLLINLHNLYQKETDKIMEFVTDLEKGLVDVAKIPAITNTEVKPDFKTLEEFTGKITASFDTTFGGYNYSPKFPMPNNYEYLLYYAYALRKSDRAQEAKSIDEHINLTLEKMALGGIYDPVEGGFARYSTDSIWKAPHFEKMLYDNGQLMSLYSHVYLTNPRKLLREVVYGIHDFVSARLTSPEGGFFCALDADSEGKEGKYYVWTKAELEELIVDDFPLFAEYYSINEKDVWEEDTFILFSKKTAEDFSIEHGMSVGEFEEKRSKWLQILAERRIKRVSPGLDDKILASWNGLMLKGYVDAFKIFKEPEFLSVAIKNANFISQKLMKEDGAIYRNYKDGKVSISGFLDDYALVAEAFIALYEVTFDEKWLLLADKLVQYAVAHFYDKEKYLFYYTSDEQQAIVARKAETSDNVIPASNSAMAIVLHALGHIMADEEYVKMSNMMFCVIKGAMNNYPQGYTNWGILMLHQYCNFYEVAIAGKQAPMFRDKLNTIYLPNKVLIGAETKSNLEILKPKLIGERTLIYVCENKTCKMPVSSAPEAVTQIERIT